MSVTTTTSFCYYWQALVVDFDWKAFWALVIALFTWVSGGADQLVVSLFWLMLVDFGLGFCRAWHAESISGDKIKHGMVKFIMYGVTVWVAVLLQNMIYSMNPTVFGFKISFAARDWMVAYLVLNESISAMEHLSAEPFNVKLPAGLLIRLKKYRGCIFSPDHTKDKHPEV